MQKTMAALVPAAGRGRRFSDSLSKVFTPLRGTPLIVHTLRAIEQCDLVDSITLVLGPEDFRRAERLAVEFEIKKLTRIVPGGARRIDSVRAGLAEIDADFVMVHDGARPLVTPGFLSDCARLALEKGSCVPYLKPIDSVKQVGADSVVAMTMDREILALVQTPQVFRREVLQEAYRVAFESGWKATDDAALVEAIGEPVHLIHGMPENIKVTYNSDIRVAEAHLREREAAEPAEARLAAGGGRPQPPLVGIGIDVHRLVEGRRLVLGGVEIPYHMGLEGHSDADALIHAICDAVLGAAGIGDIGNLFPDTDARFKDVDSAILLDRCVDRIREAGLRVWNVDATVVAQDPKLAEHIPAMRARLGGLLRIPKSRVCVKATTTERLGAIGRGEGIAAHAVATLIGVSEA